MAWWIIKSTKHCSGQHNARDLRFIIGYCIHLLWIYISLTFLTKHRHFVIKIDFHETIVRAVENEKTKRIQCIILLRLDIPKIKRNIYFASKYHSANCITFVWSFGIKYRKPEKTLGYKHNKNKILYEKTIFINLQTVHSQYDDGVGSLVWKMYYCSYNS